MASFPASTRATLPLTSLVRCAPDGAEKLSRAWDRETWFSGARTMLSGHPEPGSHLPEAGREGEVPRHVTSVLQLRAPR